MAADQQTSECAAGPKLALLRRLIIAVGLVMLALHPVAALDQVSMQLKWKHQFQFAGYYAAVEQGFYRDAGLDVTIREGGPGIDVAETVASGKADFGVCNASVLREWTMGRRLVVLAAIFQHSPLVILVARRTDIRSVSDLRGRTLMDSPGSDEIAAMLTREGVDYDALPRVAHEGNPRDLLAGRADAMVAYSTNEPFVFDQLGAAYRIFSPEAYGIDFYGDNLCASATEVEAHPDRVAAFRTASLKGWAYALAHKQATVDLILKSYSGKKSREALLFEAEHMEMLVGRDPYRIGEQDPARWQSIAATYHKLWLLTDDKLPEGLIWDRGHDSSQRGRLIPLLLVPVGFAIAALVAYRSRASMRRALARLSALPFVATMGRPRLSVIMSLLFIGLSIPILIFILLYNYNKNSAGIVSILNEAVAQTSQASVERTENLIETTESPLRFLAELAAADPGYFRTEQSRDLLYRALTSAAHIDAVYVSFDDGYHRVVTRIDEDRRRSDPAIPRAANWHSSYIDAISYAFRRTRHRKFFDIWPHEVGNYDVATETDIRTLPGYQAAKVTGTLAVTEPSINPDTGFPIISLRVPFFKGVDFLGCASANITVDVLSRFLDKHRTSARSITLVADRNNGKIIAFPDKQKGVRIENGVLKITTLADIDDPDVRGAHRQHARAGSDSFVFQSPTNGEDLMAAFANFPGGFGQSWQVITLTPIDDFVGTLKATNRLMMIVIILTMIELFFIYFASSRLSRPVENVSRELQAIESLDFDAPAHPPSNIQEIAKLESAASLLRTSLKSFSSFVPLDVVRQLIKSGIPLTLGVEPRFLTVFFSDLENFSSHSETLAPDDLLSQISTYLEQVSGAISEEGGTVDKFIGDGVMAFWNAPIRRSDHVLRACAAALRAARRMERVNDAWEAEGRPRIRIRIGLNCANVLVGNVGSSTRLSYTALGDGVNVAARLEGINKLFGTTICISDSIYDQVQTDILARPLKRVQVKGRKTEFMIYELFALRTSDDPELRIRDRDEQLSAMTYHASQPIEAGDFAAAECAYRAILKGFPGDTVAKFMLEECMERQGAMAR